MRRRGWGWQGRDNDTRNDQDRKGVEKERGGGNEAESTWMMTYLP